jgi:hypothetical protein
VRRAVFVFALILVLALGVAFSARNVGIAQEVNRQTSTCSGTLESLPQPPYKNPNPPPKLLPKKPGMRPPKDLLTLPVCTITGTDIGEEINGTDNDQMVDKIDGTGGDDTLNGYGGVNGLIGGTGQDTITGGPDTDIVFAIDEVKQTSWGKNAQIELQKIPAEVDTVSCGAGNDTVYADTDTDGTLIDNVASDCEQVEPAEPDIPVAHWFRRSGKHKR